MANRSSKRLNEWDLLCVAEDIEVGDTLRVELNQQVVDMVFVEEMGKVVVLIDRDGIRRTFQKSCLEGFGGPGYILSKSKKQLKLSEIKIS